MYVKEYNDYQFYKWGNKLCDENIRIYVKLVNKSIVLFN